jgi:hypothetical protein
MWVKSLFEHRVRTIEGRNRYAAAVEIALALDHLQQIIPAAIPDDVKLPPRRRGSPDLDFLR